MSSLETTVPHNEDILIRDSEPGDMNFIWDSWLRSWRKSPWAGTIPNNLYFQVTRSGIEQLVGRGAQFKVACTRTDLDQLLGWICYEVLKSGECVVHYAYTKDPYLGYRINDELLAECPGTKPGFYTHRYRQVAEICPHEEGWRHAAEIARRK